MGDIIRIVYNEKLISDFKFNVLTDNECSLFLPMTFTCIKDKLIGLISVDDYVNIRECKTFSADDALSIITDAVYKMRDAMERYIFPEDYILNEENVFINSEHRSIRCVFEPIKHEREFLSCSDDIGMIALEKEYISESESLYPNLEKICDLICEKSSESACRYVKKAMECVYKSRYGIDYAMQCIEGLKEEVYRLGVDKDKPFRRF